MNKNDYEVGYGKPPKKTQFKPGQSGNPKGRPKESKNLATDLQEELKQKIVVTEANKTLTVTKQRAMLKTLLARALKGDGRASNILINLIREVEKNRDPHADSATLSDDDAAILSGYAAKLKEPIDA